MTSTRARGAGLTLAALALWAAPCRAQSRDVQFGPRFSVSDDADLGLGADVRWSFLKDDRRLALTASFDYFFPETEDLELGARFAVLTPLFRQLRLPLELERGADLKYWEANLNLTWDFGAQGRVVPYVGAGVNYAQSEASAFGFDTEDSDVGANVLAGVRIARRFYLEAKREAGGGELFVLTAGVRF